MYIEEFLGKVEEKTGKSAKGLEKNNLNVSDNTPSLSAVLQIFEN